MSNWTKNGVPTTYEALLSVFLVYEENMTEDDREKCRAAKDAVMAVEGDGKTIMADSNPAKQVWQMYFGSWMDANGVAHDQTQ
jgi:hypothetical protein